ncbi:hypothetical protein ACH4SP_03835 [Streptomyces sp. NPDC021093]|uniref:hypothetical protein n=1 Tax=Streptomyces sp. NPDC021093 TaxID=3365112 RepID=UPI0037B0B1B0
MAHEDPEHRIGHVGLPDPSEPGADPRGALGDAPVPRTAAAPASVSVSASVSAPGKPGRSHGTASHSPGVVGTPDPQPEG